MIFFTKVRLFFIKVKELEMIFNFKEDYKLCLYTILERYIKVMFIKVEGLWNDF